MWPYRYAYDFPLVTLILNMLVSVSNFNRSNVNRAYIEQIDRLFIVYSID